MAELLLEIGTEEIPAGWLDDVTAQLAARFEEQALAAFLAPSKVESCSTPRRLVVRADVLARQADREEEVFGPALKVARDAAGNWTQAAQGFAKKCGVAVGALGQKPKDPAKPAEVNLVFVKKTAGAAAADVLPGVIAAGLRAIAFPKRMSWDAWLDDGKGAFQFGRPIRWMVALLDGAVVPFTIFDLVGGARGAVIVQSGSTTRGHRFLPRAKPGAVIEVKTFSDYRDKLRENFVLVDVAERRQRIEQGLAGLPTGDDHGLRAEWPQLVEYPTVVTGRVPERFQSLPLEVLETVLVHHQKYIPLVEGGKVTRFAAVTNMDAEPNAAIVLGMERVCVARFRDGAFFYEEDRKRTLESRVADLKGVTFHQKLGTYLEKSERLVKLVDYMHERGFLTAGQQAQAVQAARLAKADLTTSMVREFTELQGVIGGIYLEREGVPAAVSAAVRWHYHPIAMGSADPPAAQDVVDAAVFAAVSLADKLDTLAGYFSIGLEPKGSSDPFGLRRASQGVVRLLLDFGAGSTRVSLTPLVPRAVEGYLAQPHADAPRVVEALRGFLRARAAHLFEQRGVAADAAASVLDAGDPLDDLHDAFLRARDLHVVRTEATAAYGGLSEAFKRANNILAGQQPAAAVDEKLLERDSERQLHAAIVKLKAVPGSYAERLRAYAALREPIDRFFAREQDGGVMVMAPDPAVRANRLALLAQARELFHRIADISKLGG